MKTPHLYAVDLDGTLLTDHKTYNHEQFDRVLSLLAEQGSYLAVATGNQMPKIEQYLAGHEQHKNLYYIAENGAIIHNQGTDLALWGFSPELVQDCLTALEGFPALGIILSCRQHSFVPSDRLAAIAGRVYEQVTKIGVDLPGWDPQDPITAIRPFYPNAQAIDDPSTISETVVKIALNADPAEGIYQTIEKLQAALPAGVAATSSGFGAIDLIIEGNHKGHGLAWLADHLGLEAEQTTAFGDSGNDLEMFSYAGRAIAMEHSDPALAPVSDLTIGSNKDGAVLNFLEAELTA
ncbi:MAG: HAD family hydrolase [Rothia sp. (in: high G+C Gram-positive bacteria)]|nr:HAD family hydrolase [Rothia sp. (in: high G+C Gram-positive bacteria)]